MNRKKLGSNDNKYRNALSHTALDKLVFAFSNGFFAKHTGPVPNDAQNPAVLLQSFTIDAYDV